MSKAFLTIKLYTKYCNACLLFVLNTISAVLRFLWRVYLFLFLTIYNKWANLTSKSIVHKALNLFYCHCAIHPQICSWNQPVLNNVGNVSCSMKQQDHLINHSAVRQFFCLRHMFTKYPSFLQTLFHYFDQYVIILIPNRWLYWFPIGDYIDSQ